MVVFKQNGVFTVNNKGNVLIDFDKRRSEIALLDEATKESLVGDVNIDFDNLAPIKDVQTGPGLPPDRRPMDFTLMMMHHSSKYLVQNDRAAALEAVDHLKNWAEEEALTVTYDERAGTHYSLRRFILPVISSYAVLKHADLVTKKENRMIMKWMRQIVKLQDVDQPDGAPTGENNIHYMRGAVNAAWGALSGNHRYLRKGFRIYKHAIKDMNRNGSFTLEVGRGDYALWYQRHAVTSLTSIAEIAEVQGYDLYNYRHKGRGLDKAVKFLVRGIKRPAMVIKTASRLGFSTDIFTDTPDLGFMEQRGDRHYMAWITAYDGEIGEARLPKRKYRHVSMAAQDEGAMYDEIMGVNASAFFQFSVEVV